MPREKKTRSTEELWTRLQLLIKEYFDIEIFYAIRDCIVVKPKGACVSLRLSKRALEILEITEKYPRRWSLDGKPADIIHSIKEAILEARSPKEEDEEEVQLEPALVPA